MPDLILKDREIVAQGTIDYNGRNIAYIVSKSGTSYFIEVSFVNGAKQNDTGKKTTFEFKQKEDGKFYLTPKSPFFYKVFIEENDLEKSLILSKGREEVGRLTAFKDGIGFSIMQNENAKISSCNSFNFKSIIEKLSGPQIIKVNTIASKAFNVIESRICGIVK